MDDFQPGIGISIDYTHAREIVPVLIGIINLAITIGRPNLDGERFAHGEKLDLSSAEFLFDRVLLDLSSSTKRANNPASIKQRIPPPMMDDFKIWIPRCRRTCVAQAIGFRF